MLRRESIAHLLLVSVSIFLLGAIAFPDQIRRSTAYSTVRDDTFPDLNYSVYIPFVLDLHPWVSPFGLETTQPILSSNSLLTRATELGAGYARMGYQISWKALQPSPGADIQWDKLATFEEELRALKQAGITPLVTIKNTPYWALSPKARDQFGQPTSCGAIDEQYFDEFASFAVQLVDRYKTPEFDVHVWELGNEPDVDPTIVPQDYPFGCWGDLKDTEYYGGYHYGRMLQVISPAIKQADPSAQVWMGGLLLASPASANPQANGYPERFLKGILESGAAPYIDMVTYHWYATYWDAEGGPRKDYDNAAGFPWDSMGGGVIGKARYLRMIMDQYDVNLPLFLNETAFGCSEGNDRCAVPGEDFYNSQANHLVRFFTRGLSEDVSGFIWYTLNGPGWRYTGLLDGGDQPKLVFNTYRTMSEQLRFARYQGQLNYADIEVHLFQRNSEQVMVAWARQDAVYPITVPVEKFVGVLDRDGAILFDETNPPLLAGTEYIIDVTFEPIYIIRHP